MSLKNRYSKYIKLFLYLVAVVLINVVGMTLFFRIDLTESKIYSLSKASKKVVANLSEPLTINVFFTKNLPAPHNNTERYLNDLLEEYAIHANRYFNYRFYDVNPEAETIKGTAQHNRELANNYGINPVQIQVFEKDEVKFKKAYMGLVLIHGDMVERIPTITSINGLEFKLTTAIQKLNNKVSALLGLTEKIQIKLFLSSSLKQVAPFIGLNELAEYPDKLKEVVQKLNRQNYGKLEYTYSDPSQDPTETREWEKYNLMTLQWPALSSGKIPAGSGVIGLVMEHGDKNKVVTLLKILRIPIIGTQYSLVGVDQLEEIINENLEVLVEINEDIGYLADHGTLNATALPSMVQQDQNALTNFSSLVSQSYTLKQVNLKDEAIPESIQCLIIAGPTEKFTEYELYQIDQALMQGKNLAIFLDAFKEVAPTNQQSFGFNRGPTYVPLNTGLEKLLEHYGIRIRKSYVMDENCHRQRLPQRVGGGDRPIYFVPIIKNKFINNDLDFMKNIKGLVTVKMSPVELDETRIAEHKLTAHKLFASSEKSWEMSKRINLNPMFISPPESDTEMKTFPLAYLLEGEFPSYFAGKPIPEKVSNPADSEQPSEKEAPKSNEAVNLSKIESTGGIRTKGRPAKIFLVGSSELLKDNILDDQGESPNTMFILNVVDALNHREDIAAMRSKEQRFNPLHDSDALTKTFIKTFNIAGLPVLVVLFGGFVWMRRRSRKKTIQMMFQK